ncbi:DUF4232 domain-containing protein [Streptomyces sp. NBC_00878]|uniref:DUF4232 domain-containing protein n=1 Tax=Streptomyces sp. NBC_00878 TaxID=2975854 RepID=UPI002258B08C|nr:DUF4232 domain-containing protein [Streptomyces sp. NBC_00878]MCX4907321.1 DUF4232 domain-containing protein [Streptomyces sp. NBC_00878]
MRFTNVRRQTLLAALGLAAAVTLTACNPGGDNASGNSSSSAPAASADTGKDTGGKETGGSGSSGTSGSGGSGSSSGSNAGDDAKGTVAGTGSGSGANATKCRTDELEVNAEDNTTDKKEGVVTVSFKNAGGRDCTMVGYAGVDLKTADGDTLSVARDGQQSADLAVLKNGESAAFNITFPANDSGGSGVRLKDILVTPPNETKYVRVAWPAGSLPVSDGSSGPKLEMNPPGKVG